MYVASCREEGEKFNMWVAWMNLEAMHGAPNPDEALMATFSRAAPYCDLKQLYMKLLGREGFICFCVGFGLKSFLVVLCMPCNNCHASAKRGWSEAGCIPL